MALYFTTPRICSVNLSRLQVQFSVFRAHLNTTQCSLSAMVSLWILLQTQYKYIFLIWHNLCKVMQSCCSNSCISIRVSKSGGILQSQFLNYKTMYSSVILLHCTNFSRQCQTGAKFSKKSQLYSTFFTFVVLWSVRRWLWKIWTL